MPLAFSGEIDMKEFTVGLICLVNGSQRDKLKSLFQICDVDASGEIDRDEFYTLLRFLHLELPRARGSLKTSASTQENAAIEALTDEQLHEMADSIVNKLDDDGNGGISLDELMAWFDDHQDADVTDLFSLLNEILDSADGTEIADFTDRKSVV